MQTITGAKTESTAGTSDSRRRNRLASKIWRRSGQWVSERLCFRRSSRRKIVASIACTFLIALGVRLLHWQDSLAEINQNGAGLSAIARLYESEAQRMLKEKRILFPRDSVDPGDARLILHPPGYPAFRAAICSLFGSSDSAVTLAQLVFDALSCVIVFLIALELFNQTVAIIASMLVALSPHFAYYSSWFSPDTLPVLPILIAVYLIIRAARRPHILTILAAGMMLGVSCWLRANGLLLAPFLAAVVILSFEGRKRFLYAAALVVTVIVVISPITIRNWILYHRFVPISVDSGLALVEGIAAYDNAGRFGMPRFDREALTKDAEWHGRPDYQGNLWSPDGIERDQYRFHRGLSVIRSDPAWFTGVMVRRAFFMLRYDSPKNAVWPFTTATVPHLSASSAFGHRSFIPDAMQPVKEPQGIESMTDASASSSGASISRTQDAQTLEIIGDETEYGDQFVSHAIAVKRNTDYVLRVPVTLIQGNSAAKVTSVDRRISLTSVILTRDKSNHRSEKRNPVTSDEEHPGSEARAGVELAFASADNGEVRLVLSNNGSSADRAIVRIGEPHLFELGPTPYLWTRGIRQSIRGAQRVLFTTSRMLPLAGIGIALLVLSGRKRELALLIAVPAYYVCIHSALHTEYRYILAIHYLLFLFAGLTLNVIALIVNQVWRAAVPSVFGIRRSAL